MIRYALWAGAISVNALVALWLVIGFAMVLPRPHSYLWGYSDAVVAIPPVLAVLALWQMRDRLLGLQFPQPPARS